MLTTFLQMVKCTHFLSCILGCYETDRVHFQNCIPPFTKDYFRQNCFLPRHFKVLLCIYLRKQSTIMILIDHSLCACVLLLIKISSIHTGICMYIQYIHIQLQSEQVILGPFSFTTSSMVIKLSVKFNWDCQMQTYICVIHVYTFNFMLLFQIRFYALFS